VSRIHHHDNANEATDREFGREPGRELSRAFVPGPLVAPSERLEIGIA